MLLSLLLVPTLAAEPLSSLLVPPGSPTPFVALACSPIRPILDGLKLLQPFVSQMPAPQTEEGRYWLDILMGGHLDQVGFNLDGALGAQIWKDPDAMRVDLPYKGSREDLLALFGHLSKVRLEAVGDGWIVTPAEGKKPFGLSLEPGHLRLSSGGEIPTLAPLPEGLISGWGEAPACGVLVNGFPVPQQAAMTASAAARIPYGAEPIAIRAWLGEPAPAILDRSMGLPLGGSSTEIPLAVVVLGVSPLDVLADPQIASKIPDTIDVKRIRRFGDILPGTTMAVFQGQDGRKMDIALQVGVVDSQERPVGAARLARIARKAFQKKGTEIRKTSRTSFTGMSDSTPVYFETTPGRLFVGTRPEIVPEVAHGIGTPWVDANLAQLASQVVLAVGTRGVPGTPLTTPMLVGFGANGGIWEVSLQASETGVIAQSMIGALSSMAQPAFMKYQRMARRSELPANVQSLLLAEANYFAVHSEYLELPVTPRRPDELTQDGVPWDASGEWNKLEWQPADPTNVKGIYWVKVAPDGQTITVHGMIDADGDGEPAHYRAESLSGVEGIGFVTADDVY